MRILGILLFFCVGSVCQAQSLKLFSTINSIGFQLKLPVGYDTDLSSKISFRYKETGKMWVDGFTPTRLNYDSVKEFRGSLFLLNSSTKYILEITLTDSTPTIQKSVFIDSISTLNEPSIVNNSLTKYVSPTGSGTDYSLTKPGDLKTLLGTTIACGTTIVLRGGTYSTGDMTLNLNSECNSNSPIQIIAYQNETPVLDGGDYTKYIWIKTTGDSSMYYTTIGANLGYNALCLFDTTRLYPYAFLTPPSISPTYPSLSNLGYDQSGFYRKGNLVYIKTLDKKDPNKSNIVFSKYFWCLTVNGNNKTNFVTIKGITFKNYNKGKCDIDIFNNPTQCYPSWTLALNNTNHVVIDNCKFEFTNFPVSFNGVCNYNTVQNCEIIDGTGYWSHGAFKQTRDQNYLEPGSYGRYLESGGISFMPGNYQTIVGNIIRNNRVRGVVGGIAVGSSATGYKITETDIYNNYISWCYDGIDATGLVFNSGCINTRTWGNTVAYCPVAFSLLSPSFGPNYLFRNVAHHISERKNHNFDVVFMDCNNVPSNKIWGTGLKLNGGGINNPNAGYIYLINNTFHSSDTLGFNLYLWNSLWKKLYSANTIYYSEGKSSLFFDGVKDDTSYSFESRADNFYNKKGNIATVQPVNGIANCNTYTTVNDFNLGLKSTTQSKNISISGFNFNPGFNAISTNDFSLNASSNLIDKGIIIQGFNFDYKGNSPDIGAYESAKNGGFVKNNAFAPQTSIYPNPFAEKISVSSNFSFNTLEVFDTKGSLISKLEMENTFENSFDLNLHSGIYFIKIRYSNGNNSTFKLVKI